MAILMPAREFSMEILEIIQRVELLIADDSQPLKTRQKLLWQASLEFWAEAFPPGTLPEDMPNRWLAIIAASHLDEKASRDMVLEVLSWPATGKYPFWDAR